MIKRSALTLMFSAAMVLGIGATAGAQDDADCGASPQVCSGTPDVGVLPSAPAPVVAAPAAPQAPVATVTPRQTLPVTGTETAVLAIGGLVLVSAGGALVWRSNKAAA